MILPPDYNSHVFRQVTKTTVRPDAVTPYLGFKSRLSQIWLNRWTILILLVLARLLLSTSSLNSDMASAEREALSACRGVETTGSAMASMPHYMSQGANELTAIGLEKSVHALMQTLDMVVYGVEEMTVWYINMITGMYMCLITFAVSGSLHSAMNVVEDATKFLNKTMHKLGSEVGDAISVGGKALNDASSGVESFFTDGKNKDGLNIDTSKLQHKLDNVTLPSNLLDPLKKLNDSLPTFKDVQNLTDTAIKLPFQEVRKLIKEALPDYEFNSSMFPVPEKESLTFCTDGNGIDDFFRHLAQVIAIAKKIFIIALVVAAVLACIPMAYRELRSWRLMRKQSEFVHGAELKQDPMDVVYLVSRPHTSKAGLKVAGWVGGDDKRKKIARWFVSYITSPAALFVLCLGVAGLLSCLCQFILLRAVQKVVPELTDEVGDFSEKVVHSIQNASVSWANGTNTVINNTNNDINEKVFGWVNTTTHGINHTLNVFMDETMGVLNKTFGGTILEDPVQELFYCILGMKVEAVEKGLTWVSDHAHIDFPHVPNDTFSLAVKKASNDSSNADNFLASPGDSTTDAVSGAVIKVVHAFEHALVTETCVSAAVCGVWLLVVLLGLLRACMVNFTRDKRRGGGGNDDIPGPDDNGFFNVPLDGLPETLDPRELEQSHNPAPVYTPKPTPGERTSQCVPFPEEMPEKLAYAEPLDYPAQPRESHIEDKTVFDDYHTRF
ncbi:plasma membrane fusion protein prm1 [Ascosphaera atra]|nr:plasma membrane fusion protein prm1 [Ascosphaera atra]